jgi:uncharacterized protein (DUF697 family)
MEETVTTEETVDAAIREHVGYAMIASAIPLPAVDILAVTAVQLDLVRQLAGILDGNYDESWGKAVVTSLSSAGMARMGASIFKAVPGVGWIVGAGAQAALSGAATYAVGQIFARHFRAGGTPDTFNMDHAHELYRELIKRGGAVAESLRGEDLSALERITRLRDSGALTAEEFQTLKSRILGTN